MQKRFVDIHELRNSIIGPNDWIVLTGVPSRNIKLTDIKNKNWPQIPIIDFSELLIPIGYNLQIRNCKNIIVHKPVINMGENDDHALIVEDCDGIVINEAHTIRGKNGIFLTSNTQNTIVYRSTSTLARIDGMECHAQYKRLILCGDNNKFICCEADAVQEEGFDITSGQNHYLIDCKVFKNTKNNGIHIGHGASCTIINMNMPKFKIQIKDCNWVKMIDCQSVRTIAFRVQNSNDGLPSNVEWYGKLPFEPRNFDQLDVNSFFSKKAQDEFKMPQETKAEIDMKLATVKKYFN